MDRSARPSYAAVNESPIDWDRDNGEHGDDDDHDYDETYERRPRQFAICQCLYALFGMKTTSQAMFDLRVQLRKVIANKEKRYGEAEVTYNRALNELQRCKRTRDKAGAKSTWVVMKTAENRMQKERRSILAFEEKLYALEDVQDSRESTNALKQIGKNLQYLNLPKQVQDAHKAREKIDSNAYDMEELQKVLQQGDAGPGSLPAFIEEEALEKEVEAFFAETDEASNDYKDCRQVSRQVSRHVSRQVSRQVSRTERTKSVDEVEPELLAS